MRDLIYDIHQLLCLKQW